MPKTKISEYSTVNTDNTDIESINIAEGCAPSGINNAIRELMVHLKEFQTGASGDAFTFAGGVLISGTLNTVTGAIVSSGNNSFSGTQTITGGINSSGSLNTFSGAVVLSNTLSGVTQLNVDNLRLDGNTISSTNTNGDIVIAPNGTGDVQVDADTLRVGDSGANATISSNGNADLILQTGNATTGTVTLADGANGNLTFALNGTGQVVVNAGAVGTPTIAPTGDLNTGIFFPAADTIAFTEGGVEVLRIDSSARVGIGVTSPAAKLDVSNSNGRNARIGGLQIGGTSTSADAGNNLISSGSYWNGTNWTATATTAATTQLGNGTLLFYTDSGLTAGNTFSATERMRIDSSGNVGIGTSSPRAKAEIYDLAVSGAFNAADLSTWRVLQIRNNIELTTGTAAGIALGGDGGSDTQTAGIVGINDNSSGGVCQLAFLTATSNDSTERMRITSAGEVLVGGTTNIFSASGCLSLQFTNAAPGFGLFRNDTTISSGNSFGTIGFYGNDTTSNTPTQHAYIRALASGDHAAGDNPTDITFGTTPDGTETVAEAGRITQSGAYVLKGGTTTAAAGVGIIFPATQVASANVNCLDDYEEGTWTPTYVSATGSFTSVTYDSETAGRYTKIGNTVYIQGAIRTDAITVGTASGRVSVGGLPFTVLNAIPYSSFCVGFSESFAGDMPSSGLGNINTTNVILYYRSTANGASVALDVTDLGTGANANYVIFEGFYTV